MWAGKYVCKRAQKASPSFQLLLKLVMSIFCRKRKKTREQHTPRASQEMAEGGGGPQAQQAEPLQEARQAGGLGAGLRPSWCQ